MGHHLLSGRLLQSLPKARENAPLATEKNGEESTEARAAASTDTPAADGTTDTPGKPGDDGNTSPKVEAALKRAAAEFSDQKRTVFLEILGRVRDLHLLPDEKELTSSPERIDEFLNHLAECPPEKLPLFADCLSSEELDQVPAAFGLSLYREEMERLRSIAFRRLSWHFFERSSLIFQTLFPNAALQELLADMQLRLLKEERSTGRPRPLFVQDSLIDLVEYAGDEKALLLSLLDAAGHFFKKERRVSLSAFFKKYRIVEEEPFSLSFEALFFSRTDARYAEVEADRLRAHFSSYPAPARTLIAENIILGEEQISSEGKLELYQFLRRFCHEGNSGASLLSSLSEKAKRSFRLWLISDKLYVHCSEAEGKLKFLLTNLDRCLDLAEWEDGSLALRFESFVLLSSPDSPEEVVYYDLPHFEEAMRTLQNEHSIRELTDSDLPFPHARQVIDAFIKNRPVRLLLDPQERESARRFYDWVSGKKQSLGDAPQGILKRFF